MAGVRFQATNTQVHACFMPEPVSLDSQFTPAGYSILIVFTDMCALGGGAPAGGGGIGKRGKEVIMCQPGPVLYAF